MLEDAGTLELNGLNSDLLEEHITLLRPAPKTPPTKDVELKDALSKANEWDEYKSARRQTYLEGLPEEKI